MNPISVEIYAVLEHAKSSHNGLKRCAYGADMVSFSNERCPSYPVYIGPFPCDMPAGCLSGIAYIYIRAYARLYINLYYTRKAWYSNINIYALIKHDQRLPKYKEMIRSFKCSLEMALQYNNNNIHTKFVSLTQTPKPQRLIELHPISHPHAF